MEWAMAEPVEDTIFVNLLQSLTRLHEDLDKVELWLGALKSFQKPVPDYQPSDRHLLRPAQEQTARRIS
jgi:hypothetical protein